MLSPSRLLFLFSLFSKYNDSSQVFLRFIWCLNIISMWFKIDSVPISIEKQILFINAIVPFKQLIYIRDTFNIIWIEPFFWGFQSFYLHSGSIIIFSAAFWSISKLHLQIFYTTKWTIIGTLLPFFAVVF